MGVRGLSRLICRHDSRVSIRLDLSGSDSDGRRGLVIDGSSLLFHLEARLRTANPLSLHTVTGGCLPEFAQVARDFLSAFVAARIPLWVVFDGIQAPSKHATRILRRRHVVSATRSVESAVTRCSSTRQLTEINAGRLRSSDLSESVLMEVLNEFDIAISVAVFEADSECVRVCDEVRALGVLGEDSDYFVYDQRGGYVPFSSVVLDDDGTVYGRLYRVRAIADVFGVPVAFLPVIASLAGNDVVVEGLPELHRLHKTLKLRSSSLSVLEQILVAAKSFHSRRPSETAMQFLKHFVQTSVGDPATAKRLIEFIEENGVRKYDVDEAEDEPSTLMQLHRSGQLCTDFALDVYVNRFVSAEFGLGYSSPDDVQFVSESLAGLRQRLCHLIMHDVPATWSIRESGLGVDDFDEVVMAEKRADPEADGISNVFDQCHEAGCSPSRRQALLQFVLFGGDERRLWRTDTVFMNAVRYLIAACPGSSAEPVAAALVRMHQEIQAAAGPHGPVPTPAPPPRVHIQTLRLCAVFRHALLLAESANALLGWPLPRSRLQSCFDGARFHTEFSAFL